MLQPDANEAYFSLPQYFKTFEDLHASVIKTFKTYMQDAGKILCVMKKMREDFAITV